MKQTANNTKPFNTKRSIQNATEKIDQSFDGLYILAQDYEWQ